MLYYQCDLIEAVEDSLPALKTTGWIEERGAKAGALVEMLGWGGSLFRVAKVYSMPLEAAELKAKQDRDRHFGGSIR